MAGDETKISIPTTRPEKIKYYTGACNTTHNEQYISADGASFTEADLIAIQDKCLHGAGENIFHMSSIPGEICWRPMGERESRKFADCVDNFCGSLIKGQGADEKCTAVFEEVNDHSSAPDFFSAAGAKYYGKRAAAGLGITAAVGLITGVMFAVGHRIVNGRGAAPIAIIVAGIATFAAASEAGASTAAQTSTIEEAKKDLESQSFWGEYGANVTNFGANAFCLFYGCSEAY